MKNNSAPLYVQIAEHLRDNIKIGKWSEGNKIPPEVDLCTIFNVSRITIRKAIDELVKENLLYRERAKGTFVSPLSDTSDNYTIVKGFTDEMKELGKKALTLDAKIEVSHADKKIAMFLNVNIGDKIIILKRVRGDVNKAFAYFVTYIKYDQKYSLNAIDYYGSFYSYLKKLGINVKENREVVEAILPNYEIRNALKINKDEPVLKRIRLTSNDKKDFHEYTECYYIGKSYKYYLDFK